MTNLGHNLSQNKKLTIRCLTTGSKGYGNFNRCLNIAENLRKQNCTIFFVIDFNKNAIQELKKRKFLFSSIPVSKSLSDKTKFLITYLQKNKSDLCILDMREFSEYISKIMFEKNIKSIMIDDAWCKKAYSDVIINGTNVKAYQNYKIINKNSKLFLGTKYWVLDDNFKKFTKKVTSIKQKNISSVVISMGGSDKFNLTSSTVKALSIIDKLKIFVIIGPFFTHHGKLKKIIKQNHNISLNVSPNKIWKLFSKADIVVSTGGNTLFELACMGIPTLCIPSVKHEIKYTRMFHSQNFSINLNLREKNSSIIQSSFLQLLNDLRKQKQMCSSGKKMVDGKGLSRVTKIILKSF